MKGLGFVLLLCVVCLPHFAFADYQWPLPEFYGLSATFGESRTDHVHAGVDLSTNGKVGLPVLAIDDGKITRMKIQKRAYGKALYIEHSNGIVSLYAHLDHYSPELGLEKLYQDKVLQTGNRYPGDIFVDPPIPVHKGDVVAYSGETGAGLPHLHLELRKDDGTVAINPLLNGFKDTQDTVPPDFQAVYMTPLSYTSAINGDLQPVEIRMNRNPDGSYSAQQAPVIRGDFSISVSAYDETLRPYHRAPFRYTYSIDGNQIYAIDFNEVSYTKPAHFGLIYDLGKPGTAYYEWPVRMSPSAYPLPFAVQSKTFSTSSLTPGPHRIEIGAEDANGNASVAQIPFLINQPPVVQIADVVQSANSWTASVLASDTDGGAGSLKTTVEYSLDEGKTFQQIDSTPQDAPAASTSYSIPAPAKGRTVLLRAQTFDGTQYSPYAVMVLPPPVSRKTLGGSLQLTPFRDELKVEYETTSIQAGYVNLQYGNDSTVAMKQVSMNESQAIVPLPEINGPFTVKVNGVEASIPVHYIQAGVAADVPFQNFSLSVNPDSLYEDSFVWSKSLPGYPARYLPTVGEMVQLTPRGLAMKTNALLTAKYPRTIAHPEKLSIYVWDRAGLKWASQPSVVNPKTRTVQTKIGFLDLYALLYDNVPPTIGSMSPRKNSRISNPTPEFSARISDRGMLIDDEKIAFYIDGVAYVPEYDPDRDRAKLTNVQPLAPGAHTFRIVASDYGGNKTYGPKITFYVR